MANKYNPYFMDEIIQNAYYNKMNNRTEAGSGVYDNALKVPRTPVSLTAFNDNMGRMNYGLNVNKQGREGDDSYTIGLNANKTEGLKPYYGAYGSIGNENYNVSGNISNQGFNVSGNYVPLGLNFGYQSTRGMKPNMTIGYQKNITF
jgi:hypothetical protein